MVPGRVPTDRLHVMDVGSRRSLSLDPVDGTSGLRAGVSGSGWVGRGGVVSRCCTRLI